MKSFTVRRDRCSRGLILGAPAEEKIGFLRKDPKEGRSTSQKSTVDQETMTGCVDQQEGKYVLLDDQMLKKLADLEASIARATKMFFAKHMGHKVTVKGKKSSGPEESFKVSSIEDVAAVCAPAQGTNQ